MTSRIILLLALTLINSACASRNIMFNQSTLPAPALNTTRLFMDWDGELYPSVDMSNFDRREHKASLAFFFAQAKEEHATEWAALGRAYGLGNGNFENEWNTAQDSIIERTVRQITGMNTQDPIVVLIHGYNNEAGAATTVFDSVRSALRNVRELGRNPSFIDIYWDGRTDLGSKLRNMSAWNHAQHNAYSVGLTLRRILNRLPHDRPVRILTHSHGAKVASVALWNVASSLDYDVTPQWMNWYKGALVNTVTYRRPSHPDLRLGMIVPAMPGNVISDINPAKSRIAPVPGMLPARIVIGRNVHDLAVGKHFFGLGGIINSAWGGSTTLGARPGEFEKHDDDWNQPGQAQTAFCVDFSHTNVTPREHSWTTYMAREAIGEFLELLFSDDTELPTQYRCSGT